MALNIEQLMALADRLDKEGQHEEADKIDTMVKKLAITMVKERDPELEKEWKKERPEGRSPSIYVGRPEEQVRPSDEPMPAPEKPLLDEELKFKLSQLMEQKWNIFGPGDLELWMKEQGYIEAPQELSMKEPPRLPGIWLTEESLEKEEIQKQREKGKWQQTEKEIQEQGLHEMQSSIKVKLFDKLANVADKLDNIGAADEAGLIDGFIEKHADDVLDYKGEDEKGEQSKRYDDKHHHSLQVREPKTKQERVDREGREKHHIDTMQHVEAGALNTRYCPEHIGVMVGRVGELTYQCPLDGQVYNWETGWTDYDGKEHPGGSVAAQTPDSSGYSIPHRIFDSRENILNRVN